MKWTRRETRNGIWEQVFAWFPKVVRVYKNDTHWYNDIVWLDYVERTWREDYGGGDWEYRECPSVGGKGQRR